MEPLINYFKDIETQSILDVGTGKGGFLPVLLKTFPGAKITGIDPDPEVLESARQNYSGVNFMEMKAEKLNFDDDTFDVASISMALHHLPGVKKGLKEMKRVVKPGGFIIITETISDHLNSAQEMHKTYHHFRSQIDRLLGRFHRKTFTKDAILQLLKLADLPAQFFFEQRSNVNLVKDEANLEWRVKKMRQMLEKIKGRPEYDILRPQIEEFREKALKYGFQPATIFLIVVRKRIIE
jgi:ubiquinone/menaquinone biosynthesis C-methylase UbiE